MLLFSVESKFSQEGLIRRGIKVVFNDRCQAGLDPSGLQRDAIDMPNRNGCTPRWYMRVEKQVILTQV